MKKFTEGILVLIKILKQIIKQICKNFENFLELFKRKEKKEKGIPICCVKVPDDQRPRPDPYIYSQDWLIKRGFAVTWQNPDFSIFDMNGNQVVSNELRPATRYRIEVVIHNNSPMASVNTKIHLTIRTFGIQTGIIWGSPKNTLDIPAAGSNKTNFTWETPSEIGHVCLIATIFHVDDANPLNNIGQHNAEIIRDNSKVLSFKIKNFSKTNQHVFFSFDTYSLPEEPLGAKNREELRSSAYLKKLQNLNSRSLNLITEVDVLKGIGNKMIIEPNTEIDIEINQSFFEDNSTLNINAFSSNEVLLGGVTFQKQKK